MALFGSRVVDNSADAPRTVKASGRDSIDSRRLGGNKVAKFDREIARHAGKAMGLGQRGRTDIVRRP